jgi:hypothetical protein
MQKVCIESPYRPSSSEVTSYAGTYTRYELARQNLVYARLALRDSLRRGEAPIASHLLYTQVWGEDTESRNAGIRAGIEWAHRADRVVLYEHLGESEGMRLAKANAKLINVACEYRRLFAAADARAARAELARDLSPAFPCLEELRWAEVAAIAGKL